MKIALIYIIGVILIGYAIEWAITIGVDLFPDELRWLVDDDPKWGE